MCPACIESAAVIVAGAASTGGILAACIGKLKKLFTTARRDEGTVIVSQSTRSDTCRI
jgi:hypothetical protein